ncbi:MAG: hypothetical protein KAT68_08330 [Bacteroidales bacterium]|nr:hypothetical protein [Bacteroidales bacterium]
MRYKLFPVNIIIDNPFTIEWENGADFASEFLYEMAMKEGNMQDCKN